MRRGFRSFLSDSAHVTLIAFTHIFDAVSCSLEILDTGAVIEKVKAFGAIQIYAKDVNNACIFRALSTGFDLR